MTPVPLWQQTNDIAMASVAANNAIKNLAAILLFLNGMSGVVKALWEAFTHHASIESEARLVIYWTWILGTLLYWIVSGAYAGTMQLFNSATSHTFPP